MFRWFLFGLAVVGTLILAGWLGPEVAKELAPDKPMLRILISGAIGVAIGAVMSGPITFLLCWANDYL